MKDDDKSPMLRGAHRSSPYPVSRLAPAFEALDLAAEVSRAESMLSARTEAKLKVIAEQIQALQAQARKVLEEARTERALTHAGCAFRRIPGHIYHLYRKEDGGTFFSMLAPHDWRGQPPHPFLGSFRLESDLSWTPANKAAPTNETGELVTELLRLGGASQDDDPS